MRIDYEEDEEEELWDDGLEEGERQENPSSAAVAESYQGAEEDEFGDDEEEEYPEASAESPVCEVEGGEAAGGDGVCVPEVRAATLGRVRRKLEQASEGSPAEEEEAVECVGERPEGPGGVRAGAERPEGSGAVSTSPREAVERPEGKGVLSGGVPEAAPALPSAPGEGGGEPMYDQTGLGGFANALVGLFTRRRK